MTDPKERDKVLKQSFSVDRVPSDLDAIVIGSGIGGLTTAALLAKIGRKVLVLEQHDQVLTDCLELSNDFAKTLNADWKIIFLVCASCEKPKKCVSAT